MRDKFILNTQQHLYVFPLTFKILDKDVPVNIAQLTETYIVIYESRIRTPNISLIQTPLVYHWDTNVI